MVTKGTSMSFQVSPVDHVFAVPVFGDLWFQYLEI